MFKLFGVKVIPAAVIHPLSEQLNWRLCSIFLFLWHVQVIDEDNDFVLTLFRPEVPFSSSCTHFRVYEPLDLIGDSLSRKGRCQESVLLIVIIVVELVSDVNRFTSTSGTTEKDMHMIFDIKVQEIVVSD